MCNNSGRLKLTYIVHSNGESVMTPSSTRRTIIRTDDQTVEEIKLMTSQMSANDWRERHAGIVKLQEMCECHPEIVGANITKVEY